MPILLLKLDRRALLQMAGLPQSVLEDMGRKDRADEQARCWTVGCLVSGPGAGKSKFHRSVEKHVDDLEKKRNFATMVGSLFDAICESDYQAAMADGSVGCKPAHTFKFAGQTHTIWELKEGKKDRIYFFTLNRRGMNILVPMLAFHKKDQQTPDEVKVVCEGLARRLLSDTAPVEFC